MKQFKYLDKKGSFTFEDAQKYSYLYYPIASATGLKSCVTPQLHGDAKLDQNHFVLEPVSCENLHQSKAARNFWCRMQDGSVFSATGTSAYECQ
ncbi:MAG: hypothetical protein R3Y24_12330 [Eubacteriales bacterium]